MDGNPQDDFEGILDEEFGNQEESTNGEVGDKAKRTRVVSAIEFPYVDLDQAVFVPETIHSKLGTKGLPEQLSGAMNLRGGSYARRMAGAKMFGLIEKDGEHFKITDLGRRVLNQESAPSAKVEAFLNVQLFKRLYDDFRGSSLPADRGIENHMKELGVPDKATESARQIFRRCARQAGFFPFGEDRLIMPVFKDGGTETPPVDSAKESDAPLPSANHNDTQNGGNGGASQEVEQLRRTVDELKRQLDAKSAPSIVVPDLPVAISGVLTTLPLDPNDNWTDAELSEWVAMFRTLIKQSFKGRIDPPIKTE